MISNRPAGLSKATWCWVGEARVVGVAAAGVANTTTRTGPPVMFGDRGWSEATTGGSGSPIHAGHRRSTVAVVFRWFVAAALVVLVGCRSAAQPDGDETESGVSITLSTPRPMPHGPSPAGDRIKRGHWTSFGISAKANREDERGTIVAKISDRRTNLDGDRDGRRRGGRTRGRGELGVASSPDARRDVVLPRRQRRTTDVSLIAAADTRRSRPAVDVRLTTRSGDFGLQSTGGLRTLGETEWFFVVLTERPERFRAWEDADWAVDSRAVDGFVKNDRNYHLVLPAVDGLVPVGSDSLHWTSTAVLVIDRVDPRVLTADQLRAVRDWVDRGGRLILNGPSAASAIDGGPLQTFAAIRNDGNEELDPAAVDRLLKAWTIDGDASDAAARSLIESGEIPISVSGPTLPDARAIEGTGDLLVRRTIGRGVVIQSRIDLTSDWLRAWRSMSGFMNAVVLERPARRFLTAPGRIDGEYGIEEADVTNVQYLTPGGDPGRNRPTNSSLWSVGRDGEGGGAISTGDGLIGAAMGRGVRQASAIDVPPRRRIGWILAGYLGLLVPVNFLVFRLLGRVEWAWAAVPLMAAAGMVFVARSTRLDIGFGRSVRQWTLVDLPAGSDRAIHRSVAAVYTSLSADHTLKFVAKDALAIPTAIVRSQDTRTAGDASIWDASVTPPHLRSFDVTSNRTRLATLEWVDDVGGPIRLDPKSIVNNTRFDLASATLIDFDDPDVDVQSLGTVAAGSTVPISADTAKRDTESAGRKPTAGFDPTAGRDPFAAWRAEVIDRCRTYGGGWLIAEIQDPPRGFELSPAPDDRSDRGLLTAQVRLPDPAVPRRDANLPPD